MSLSVLAGSVLCAVLASADDGATNNVFNADMSNSDLATIVTSFQEVCLPFVMHTTELPQSLDQQHHVKLLAAEGFQFRSRERVEDRVRIEPGREEWRPASQSVSDFNKGITTVTLTREFSSRDAWVPPVYKAITREIDSYVLQTDTRQTVLLGWNYASQNHPGKDCEVRMSGAAISGEVFEADFIQKDSDWTPERHQDGSWSQCSADAPDAYWFTAERREGYLSLSVRRNDFFAPELCKPGAP